jgi:hypothetical protein
MMGRILGIAGWAVLAAASCNVIREFGHGHYAFSRGVPVLVVNERGVHPDGCVPSGFALSLHRSGSEYGAFYTAYAVLACGVALLIWQCARLARARRRWMAFWVSKGCVIDGGEVLDPQTGLRLRNGRWEESCSDGS